MTRRRKNAGLSLGDLEGTPLRVLLTTLVPDHGSSPAPRRRFSPAPHQPSSPAPHPPSSPAPSPTSACPLRRRRCPQQHLVSAMSLATPCYNTEALPSLLMGTRSPIAADHTPDKQTDRLDPDKRRGESAPSPLEHGRYRREHEPEASSVTGESMNQRQAALQERA
jgi:hypothetical protein